MLTRKLGTILQTKHDKIMDKDYEDKLEYVKAFGLGMLEGISDMTLLYGAIAIGGMVYAAATGKQIDITFVKLIVKD